MKYLVTRYVLSYIFLVRYFSRPGSFYSHYHALYLCFRLSLLGGEFLALSFISRLFVFMIVLYRDVCYSHSMASSSNEAIASWRCLASYWSLKLLMNSHQCSQWKKRYSAIPLKEWLWLYLCSLWLNCIMNEFLGGFSYFPSDIIASHRELLLEGQMNARIY